MLPAAAASAASEGLQGCSGLHVCPVQLLHGCQMLMHATTWMTCATDTCRHACAHVGDAAAAMDLTHSRNLSCMHACEPADAALRLPVVLWWWFATASPPIESPLLQPAAAGGETSWEALGCNEGLRRRRAGCWCGGQSQQCSATARRSNATAEQQQRLRVSAWCCSVLARVRRCAACKRGACMVTPFGVDRHRKTEGLPARRSPWRVRCHRS